jgi:hypothetical protein
MFICRKNFEKFSRVKTGQWQNIRKCLGNLWPAALILGIDHKRRQLICIVQNGEKVNDQPKLAFKSPSRCSTRFSRESRHITNAVDCRYVCP